MAIVQGPLLSLSASGSIAGSVTYRASLSGQQCIKPSRTSHPRSTAQLGQMQLIFNTVKFWRASITDQTTRNAWTTAARIIKARYSGYQMFVAKSCNWQTGAEACSAITFDYLRFNPYLQGRMRFARIDTGVPVSVSTNCYIYLSTDGRNFNNVLTDNINTSGWNAWQVTTILSGPIWCFLTLTNGMQISGVYKVN